MKVTMTSQTLIRADDNGLWREVKTSAADTANPCFTPVPFPAVLMLADDMTEDIPSLPPMKPRNLAVLLYIPLESCCRLLLLLSVVNNIQQISV